MEDLQKTLHLFRAENSNNLSFNKEESRHPRNMILHQTLSSSCMSIKFHKCPCCDKNFGGSWMLDRHMRCHTGEKPFVCDICNKRFTERGNLTTHKRIHSGDKPYKCKYCDYCANQSSHLKIHLTNKHGIVYG